MLSPGPGPTPCGEAVGENLLIALWKDSGCEEREAFLEYLDQAYSLDMIHKELVANREKNAIEKD